MINSAPLLLAWFDRSGSLRGLYWNFDPRLQAFSLDLLLIPHPHPVRTDAIWPLVVPGWTLNLEACFYLVFTLSLLVRRVHLELAMLMLVGLFLIGQVDPPTSAVMGFYTQERILCFAVGILAYRVMQGREMSTLSLLPWLCAMISALGLMIGVGLHLGLGNDARPAIAVAAGLVLMVSAMAPDSFKSRMLALLGDSSYAIYLLHTVVAFPLVHWMLRVAGLDHLRFMPDVGFLCTAPVMLFHVLVSSLVGILGHKLLEKPLTESARVLSALLFIRLGGLAHLSYNSSPADSISPPARPLSPVGKR